MASDTQPQVRAMFPTGAPGAPGDVRLTLPARPENVAVIRHVLSAFAEALRLPDGMVEDVRLAVTEACTNVVRHAYGRGRKGAVEVVMAPDAGGEILRVTVTDHGRGIGPSPDKSGPGLGLPLIAAIADSLEIEHGRTGSRLAMSFGRGRAEAA